MKILIVAATKGEVMGELGNRDEVDLLVTGVGCVPTVYRLTQALAEGSYDLIVNVGVAGGFGRDLPVGTVVQVGSDRSEEHTSELQSLMSISYSVFCLKKKTKTRNMKKYTQPTTK